MTKVWYDSDIGTALLKRRGDHAVKRVNYETFRKEVAKRNVRFSRENPRSIRTKPRDPMELQLLVRLAHIRKEKALASRQYELLSPRRWRVNATKDIE